MHVQLITVLDLHLLRARLEFFDLSLLHRWLLCVSYVMPHPGGGDFHLPVTSERCNNANFDKTNYTRLFNVENVGITLTEVHLAHIALCESQITLPSSLPKARFRLGGRRER